jgi:mRNA interferase RelE/StbE
MTYKLEFKISALKEWQRLDRALRDQFKKKLLERLTQPRVESARLTVMPDCYKIKLRAAGYRLGYRVEDKTVTVIVVAVGKCENSAIFLAAAKRIK